MKLINYLYNKFYFRLVEGKLHGEIEQRFGSQVRVYKKGHLYSFFNVVLGTNSYITARNKVVIGSDTLIAPNCIISDSQHDPKDITKFKVGETVIGNNSWICANCIIINSTIPEYSVIPPYTKVINDVWYQGSIKL